MTFKSFDVIVIGGGATGAGIARDCSLRGLSVALVEQFDIANGATGRNHGLLHSGARYAVTDSESARECINENLTLKRIASHCVEPCGGLFLTLEQDDLSFQSPFVEACRQSGIDANIIDPTLALGMDPSINPNLKGAVSVPDGAIDPFRLTASNLIDALAHGAEVFTYHQVTGVINKNGRIEGVELTDKKSGKKKQFISKITVNAAGIWGQHIARLADVKINMLPSKGSLLIFGHRVNQLVLNRCRKPADADILVPGDTISLIGTTSTVVDINQIDDMRVTREEVDTLIREGAKLSPSLAHTRILRAYAGVRPLVSADGDPSGRSVSRGIVLLDHKTRDGLDGFISITGGKLMTYRLMAEMATDLICEKLAIESRCMTAELPLPGSDLTNSTASSGKENRHTKKSRHMAVESAYDRHGNMAERIFSEQQLSDNEVVCECEAVTQQEIKYAIKEQGVKNLNDLRRRTRLGMGTCQGELCACRATGILTAENIITQEDSDKQLTTFLDERWKGIRPIAWGESLREAQYASWVYGSVCGLNHE